MISKWRGGRTQGISRTRDHQMPQDMLQKCAVCNAKCPQRRWSKNLEVAPVDQSVNRPDPSGRNPGSAPCLQFWNTTWTKQENKNTWALLAPLFPRLLPADLPGAHLFVNRICFWRVHSALNPDECGSSLPSGRNPESGSEPGSVRLFATVRAESDRWKESRVLLFFLNQLNLQKYTETPCFQSVLQVHSA